MGRFENPGEVVAPISNERSNSRAVLGLNSESQLKPELLEAACLAARIPLTLRRQPRYDHGYAFVATFMEDHLQWHAERLAERCQMG